MKAKKNEVKKKDNDFEERKVEFIKKIKDAEVETGVAIAVGMNYSMEKIAPQFIFIDKNADDKKKTK